MTAPSDRERAEMYRAEMSQLRAELRVVVLQRDILAAELLANAEDIYSGSAMTVLSDLVAMDNADDYRGLLS